eukprot:snap_masked-scaffold_43-processed-gene-1.70-mRNA-1 protein AED:1.00 eAED:1.00 QI:0/0/0/0/1/1/2/0/77
MLHLARQDEFIGDSMKLESCKINNMDILGNRVLICWHADNNQGMHTKREQIKTLRNSNEVINEIRQFSSNINGIDIH